MAVKPSGGEDVFNVEKIRQLIDLMSEYDLREIDLKQSEQQIRLVRGAAVVPGQMMMPAPMMAAPVMAGPAPQAGSAGASQGSAGGGEADGPHIAIIKSPMVGTFYNRANPKAEPFVKVGSAITADSTVCIIEAMKVFNEIPAEVRGTIVAVLVENEQPVDFGRPLFKVDTRG
ncbi:MAG: acetyl-CoA carboxylase biotin carboxyl carrier protein [Aureliella sp.]